MLVGLTISSRGDRPLIMLGLSRVNVDRLIAGKPMLLTPETHEIPAGMEILIFFGETEDAMAAEIQRVTTVLEIDDRRKKES